MIRSHFGASVAQMWREVENKIGCLFFRLVVLVIAIEIVRFISHVDDLRW